MIEVPFKIFPYSGYLNSQFQLIRFDNNCKVVTIYKEGSVIKTIDLSLSNYTILTEFQDPGIYEAKCNIDGKNYTQSIEIKNSIRLGSSELKSVFTFDEIPYSFFLMKDRMLIYDEANGRLLTENNISPTEMIKIDLKHILFRTELKSSAGIIENFALYSLAEFRIIWELKNNYKEILFLGDENLLWVHNFIENRIICYSLKEVTNNAPKEIQNIEIGNYFKKLDLLNHLYIDSKEFISFINLKDNKIHLLDKQGDVAIDNRGNYFQLKDDTLNCKNLLTDAIKEVSYRLSFKLNLSQDGFLYIGKDFILNESSDFDNAIQELIERKLPKDNEKDSSITTTLTIDEQFESIYPFHSLFNSSSGIILLTKKVVKKLLNISYQKNDFNNWKGLPLITSNTNYSLVVIDAKENLELKKDIKLCSNVYSDHYFALFQTDSTYLFIKENEIVKEIGLTASILILPNFNQNNYILISTTLNNYDLFSTDDFNTPVLEDIEVLNKGFLRTHGVIWFAGKQKNTIQNSRFISAFSLNLNFYLQVNESLSKHSSFKDASDFVFKESYMLSSTKTIINPKNGDVKDAVVGEVITTSQTLDKIFSRRDAFIYFSKFDNKQSKFINVEVRIPVTNYKGSHLSPNGKFLVLQKTTQEYLFFDIETGEETKFLSGKFIAFSKEGNLIYEDNISRTAKIADPLTFKDVTPPNYHHYRFISPDGQLYSQVSTKTKYFNKITNQYTDSVALVKYRNDLDLSSYADEETKTKIKENRRALFELYKAKFEDLGVKNHEDISSNTVIKIELFTEIGIVGTEVTSEIPFPPDLVFYNYASFSYDNKYFGYVGKPGSRGLIHLFKLNFNSQNKTLVVEDNYLSRYPGYASWVCGFSKNGFFATYDSNPDTYIIKADEELFQIKYNDDELRKNIVRSSSGLYSTFKKWIEIKGKNFLCFSPSGNFIALSEQGYEPLTLGGYGHKESGTLYIANAITGSILISFGDHGERFVNPKITDTIFVAFSEDESKIMSMSKDGVVIVRNIDLTKYEDQGIADNVFFSPSSAD